MRRSIIIALAAALTSGCLPALYIKHVGGRVVDKDGRPVANATLLFMVDKMCGSVGGSGRETMREEIGKTDEDGNFSMTQAGPGLFYFVGIAGCVGFKKSLQICKHGRWSEGVYQNGYQDAARDGSGAFIYAPSRTSSDRLRGDSDHEARAQCASTPRDPETDPGPSAVPPPSEDPFGKSGLAVRLASAGSKTSVSVFKGSARLYSVELLGDIQMRKISDDGAHVALVSVGTPTPEFLVLDGKGEVVERSALSRPTEGLQDVHFSPSGKWLVFSPRPFSTHVLSFSRGSEYLSDSITGWEVDDEGTLSAWVNEGRRGEWIRDGGRKIWKPATEVLQRRYRRTLKEDGYHTIVRYGKVNKLKETRIWNTATGSVRK